MRLTEETATYLTSDEGGRLLAEIAALPGDGPQRVLTLRKRGISPEVATAGLAVAEARRRAASRFPDADRLFFTADALAQATSPGIAAYHARQLAAAGYRTVADLGCGIGMDALALAEAGLAVVAIERDPARLIFARANAVARGLADRITFEVGDVTATGTWEAEAAFWDPSRRSSEDGHRISRHGEMYEPPLSFLEEMRTRVRGGCIKLSPALPDATLETLDGRVEFLSEGRECKEACLWFGDALGAAGEEPYTSVLLPERLVLPGNTEEPPLGEIGAYLFDPDPSLIRSHALGAFAESTPDVRRIGASDAYLTGDTLPEGPAARAVSAYRVLDAQPYRPGPIGALLRDRGIGRLVIKKRHFPLEPDALQRALQLKRTANSTEGTLVLVRTASAPKPVFWAVLCEPVVTTAAATKNDADL